MFFLLISLSSSLLLAICAVAVPTGNTPTISFDTTLTWIPITNATHNIATVSQSRLLSLKAATADDISERSTTFSAPATDFGPGSLMLAPVQIGNPPTTFTLIVDTGSSNLVVGTGNTKYKATNSSHSTGDKVSQIYVSGGFSGNEYLDNVAMGGVTASNQSIGVAKASSGFGGQLDGILGLGPRGLNAGTFASNPLKMVTTFTETLSAEGRIPSTLMALTMPLALKPNGGSLDFGAPNPSKFIGNITYTPITQNKPARAFWGIDVSVSYGGQKTTIMKQTAGMVDSGNTIILLPTDAFNAYKKSTGAILDSTTGLLRISNPAKLQSLFFKIGGQSFEFTANAQMWPRAHNNLLGGVPNATYLIIGSTGASSGQGLDFALGFSFLQRFYAIFDTTNVRMGFAKNNHTMDTSN